MYIKIINHFIHIGELYVFTNNKRITCKISASRFYDWNFTEANDADRKLMWNFRNTKSDQTFNCEHLE